MEQAKILLAEDERTQREELEEALVNAGFQVKTAPDGITAIQMVKERKYDMVLTDMKMPAPISIEDDECGLLVLRAVKEWHPETEVIIFTAYATAKTVRLADSYNVYKYVDKPIDIENLIQDIKLALKPHSNANFIAVSDSMRTIVTDVMKVAKTPVTVLLLGETGTGKDELAKFIHANSGRPSDRFVTVNCPAIPKELFESELFGYAPKSGISRDKSKVSPAELAKLIVNFLPEDLTPPNPKMIGQMINREFGVKSKRGGKLGRYLYEIPHADVTARLRSYHLGF